TFIILTMFASFCLSGQQPHVFTVAGTGSGSYSGDGGPATAASIGNAAIGGVFDRSGNYYYSVRFYNRIRKISASGIITTIAGNGTQGYSGDGGQATAAKINNPYFLAIDTLDNLYIAEVEGARVRKVDLTTGIISTVAGNGYWSERGDGGLATNASLHWCVGVCIDKHQDLYISTGVHTVRKVNHITGTITTVVGSDTSGFGGFAGDSGLATNAVLGDFVYGLAVDTANNLLIADVSNKRIRKVETSTGIINTFAGNDSFRFNGEGLLAVNTNLWGLFALAVDNENNTYLTELYNYRIRKIKPAEQRVYTIMGTGLAGYSVDSALADTSQTYFPSGLAV
ncbi:MAG: hypothetical protein EBZ77_18135, partial [Chitinophagia bacterium]|nr:hypothetical protein [Chitinophagia bacterium]